MSAACVHTDCPNDVATWLADERAELIREEATEILADWISGPRDHYADAKASRLFLALASRLHGELKTENDRRRRESWNDAAEARAERRDAERAAA